MKKILILLISILVIPNALGNDFTFFSLLGYGSLENRGGFEMGIGGKFTPYENINVDITPVIVIFLPNDGSRYTEENTSNGQTICRDKTNGQFAEKENCGPHYKYGFQSSIKYNLHQNFEAGVGTRIGNGVLLYAVALLKFNTKVGIEGKLGSRYSSFALRYDFLK